MKRGGALESLVARTASYLARNGIARIWKWPEPMYVQKTFKACESCGTMHSGMEAIPSGKTGFDFFGYTTSGQFIAIECKEGYNKPTIKIPEHQIAALQEVGKVGGIALLVWSRGHEERLFTSTQLEPARWVEGLELARKKSQGDAILDLDLVISTGAGWVQQAPDGKLPGSGSQAKPAAKPGAAPGQ